ncbi:MAG: DUF2332 family protein, partial [Deltaproteobacteria bacterium]
MNASHIRDEFREQSAGWARMGSPLMARLANLFAARLDDSTQTGQRMLNWTPNPEDALLLRLTGGLHRLILEGRAPVLAAAYSDPDSSDDALWSAVDSIMRHRDGELLQSLDSAPQTNEVRRSSILIAVAHLLTDRFKLPLVISELGSSAGLNLLFDHYCLDINGTKFGPENAALTLRPDWQGPLPPQTVPQIVAREGVDLNPLDPKADALRLLSYIWADQTERLARTQTALDLAAEQSPQVTQGDAVDWLEQRLTMHLPGRLHVIWHTVFWQYLSPEARARATALLDAAGGKATDDAPLAHFA